MEWSTTFLHQSSMITLLFLLNKIHHDHDHSQQALFISNNWYKNYLDLVFIAYAIMYWKLSFTIHTLTLYPFSFVFYEIDASQETDIYGLRMQRQGVYWLQRAASNSTRYISTSTHMHSYTDAKTASRTRTWILWGREKKNMETKATKEQQQQQKIIIWTKSLANMKILYETENIHDAPKSHTDEMYILQAIATASNRRHSRRIAKWAAEK